MFVGGGEYPSLQRADMAIRECTMVRGRLWAEIFEVREENGQMFWGRVSDDLVPVNVVCVQDTPSTVYQITAYNSLVKKIFDIRLVQPGSYSHGLLCTQYTLKICVYPRISCGEFCTF